MAQSAQHFYRKLSHVVNGSQYFHQLCKRVVLSAWLLHSAVESSWTCQLNSFLQAFCAIFLKYAKSRGSEVHRRAWNLWPNFLTISEHLFQFLYIHWVLMLIFRLQFSPYSPTGHFNLCHTANIQMNLHITLAVLNGLSPLWVLSCFSK